MVDEEVDPLDAFMESLNNESPAPTSSDKIVRHDLDNDRDDHLESFVKDRAKKTALNIRQGEAVEELDYDSDDLPVAKKRTIEPLAPLDHQSINYSHFNKLFYEESQSTSKMTDEELQAARKALKISVHGLHPPRLVTTFSGFNFPSNLEKMVLSQGFERPTAIQMQTVPAAMSGRDILGIAATGSGKTLSFVWPLLIHVFGQPPLNSSESGPIGVIVAPTRELANQIYEETRKFARCFERARGDKMERAIRVAPLLGGLGRGDMRAMLKSRSHEVVVATPGRFIDMVKAKLISTSRTTMLVIDEADKMFDMGFEPQLKSIVGQIRPDRQTLLFSATFKPTVEGLARDILSDPIRVNVGTIGAANQDVTQVVEICADDEEKWSWLSRRIEDFVLDGAVLIFAGSKMAVEDLTSRIRDYFGKTRISVASIHGDKSADERTQIMNDYKNDKFKVLVATDLAARGLDVKTIKTVVNYHAARDIDSHTHRIGRTGRAGDKNGIAYTLLTPVESHFAGLLIKNLENARQEIPRELVELSQRQHRKYSSHGHSNHHYGGKDRSRGDREGGRSNFGASHAAVGPHNHLPQPNRLHFSSTTDQARSPHQSFQFERATTTRPHAMTNTTTQTGALTVRGSSFGDNHNLTSSSSEAYNPFESI